jgi:hypothetical protein
MGKKRNGVHPWPDVGLETRPASRERVQLHRCNSRCVCADPPRPCPYEPRHRCAYSHSDQPTARYEDCSHARTQFGRDRVCSPSLHSFSHHCPACSNGLTVTARHCGGRRCRSVGLSHGSLTIKKRVRITGSN